jgi:predicted SnoaL-like aldol condensation-catalyzing enzyme
MSHQLVRWMSGRLAVLLPCLLVTGMLSAAESLAPPHAPLIEGLPVPVTAHTDPRSLLASAQPELAMNKQLVYDFWRNVIVGGKAADAGQYLHASYTEHNPLLPTGARAFQDYLARNAQPGAVPATIPDLVTLVAEGPYVALVLVAQYPEANGTDTYTSTHFELFRIDGGLIAEHWDSTLFRAGQQVPDFGADKALPVTGLKGTAQYALLASDNPDLFANKRLAFDLWRTIPEGGREELSELYVDPSYIQHNPNAATGREGFREYMARRPDSDVESWLETPLVAMIAEGDLVVQVLQTERVHEGLTYSVPWFDMFRVENGRVIEHWDTAAKGEIPSATRTGPLGL